MKPVYLNCQQVFVDFSAATHLKTIGLQAFFQVRGLGDDPGLTRTTDDAFYIRAKYIDAWTVTFDSNGGTAPAGTDYSPKQVEKGKGTSVPYAPQKKGYYSYWKKADGIGKYYANDYLVPDSDVTLVAQYDPIEHTIKYDPNLPDATGMVENQTYVYDTADFKLTEDTFTGTTKDFLGWSLTQDTVTASYPSGTAVDDALKAAMVASADKTVPMYDAKGNPIQYAAKERPVSGYMTIYKNVAPYESESSFIYDGGTIINRAVTQIAVRKVWKGMDVGEKRPDIKLTLYCKL